MGANIPTYRATELHSGLKPGIPYKLINQLGNNSLSFFIILSIKYN